MENQTPSVGKSAMTYGLYMGLALVVYSLIIYLVGLTGNKAAGWVSYIIIIAMLAFAMMNFRDKVNGGYLRYGQGVGLGILTALYGGILSSIFTFILVKYIDPGVIEQIVNQAMEEAMAGGANEEALAMAEKMVRMFTSPIAMLLMGIVGSAFIGAIISLILAAIFKKEPPVFEPTEAAE
ncbi:DUF4199 domain-containing protein [Carboxylicivirga mesophila]|uniref:DUF4199 domain-containing protein n=1 Tax=Carboxylicivirga mesophila TaxID=1166478 RepID=A0ABS5KEF5_9BACT|nr:DUF4199 domain-containing protein [Carboxylicivirga mesophila]MBS2213434.1 DUF4199 domain-containing protein [Carboxylicivirga mesophila]